MDLEITIQDLEESIRVQSGGREFEAFLREVESKTTGYRIDATQN